MRLGQLTDATRFMTRHITRTEFGSGEHLRAPFGCVRSSRRSCFRIARLQAIHGLFRSVGSETAHRSAWITAVRLETREARKHGL